MRRAAVESQAKTKEELKLVPSDEEDDDENFEESTIPDNQTKSKRRKVDSANMPAVRGRVGGGGICLSDDEEEDIAGNKSLEQSTSNQVQDNHDNVASDESKIKTSNIDFDFEIPRKAESMGNLLARMNSKKKPKAKTGSKVDSNIRMLLKEDNQIDKTAAADAAKKALASIGKVNVEEKIKFAGATISVVRSVDKASVVDQPKAAESMSNLDKIVDELKSNKRTVNTVVKSSYDWDKFKEDQGIADELEKYSKNGFVEKQAFLQRVDERQFELEKAERDKARAFAAASAEKKQ